MKFSASVRVSDFLLRSSFFFRLSNLYQQQQATLKILHNFTKKVIRDRRQELVSSRKNDSSMANGSREDYGIKKKEVFLDILLKSNINGEPMTDSEILEEVDTFMFEVWKEMFETFNENMLKQKPIIFRGMTQRHRLSFLRCTILQNIRRFKRIVFMKFMKKSDAKIMNWFHFINCKI